MYKVYVIGDLVKDTIVTGVEGTDGPGVSRNCSGIHEVTGGMGGNTFLSLHRLGEEPVLVSWLGDDATGNYIKNELSGEHVGAHPFVEIHQQPTRQVVCYGNGAGRSFLAQRTDRPIGVCAGLEKLVDTFETEELPGHRIAYIGGLNGMPELLTPEGIRLLQNAGKHGVSFIIDFVPRSEALTREELLTSLRIIKKHVRILIMAEVELMMVIKHDKPKNDSNWGEAFGRMDDVALKQQLGTHVKTLRSMLDNYDSPIFVKLGRRGSAFFLDGNHHDPELVPAVSPLGGEQIKDCTGAGDAWCAGLIAAGIQDFATFAQLLDSPQSNHTDSVRKWMYVASMVAFLSLQEVGGWMGVPQGMAAVEEQMALRLYRPK